MSAATVSNAPFPVTLTAPVHEAIALTCDDGTQLGARFYRALLPRAAALIVPAMGVPQRYYEAFASWLAEQGVHALSFDYRGTGESRHGKLSAERADIFTWAHQDTGAALAELKRRAPGLPINWVGHSLGGQIVPLVPGHERVAKVITVATGSGYWRQNAPQLRRKVWIFWFGAVPALTPLFGYFPGKRLGMVGDLPKGVIRQWRKWCLDPEYLVGAEPGMRDRYADMTVPLTSFSFSDDDMMSKANTASIHSFFSGSQRKMLRFHPRELGLAKVGHFGFFRREMQAPLWETKVLPELALS